MNNGAGKTEMSQALNFSAEDMCTLCIWEKIFEESGNVIHIYTGTNDI